jgi:hypothetical protein
MNTLLRTVLLLTAVLAIGTGCAARQAYDGPETAVLVENQSLSDMRIYAIATGQRIRLGSVGGFRTQALRIPPAIVGGGRELSFEADPVAGLQPASSFNIYVLPGDTVTITIPPRVR